MKLFVFIPGYITSHTYTLAGDTYVDIADRVRKEGFDFAYISLPNNNYGDRGNATLDEYLEHVVTRYNSICSKANVGPEDTIVLAGHSMGGLLVAKLITAIYLAKLDPQPNYVRVINPAIFPIVSWHLRVVATMLSFLPDVLLRTLAAPVSISTKDALFPGSLAQSPVVKLLLASSVARKTGSLFLNNETWDLTPAASLTVRIKVIACQGDPVASFEEARAYADRFKIALVSLPLDYHEYFDNTVMTGVLSDIR